MCPYQNTPPLRQHTVFVLHTLLSHWHTLALYSWVRSQVHVINYGDTCMSLSLCFHCPTFHLVPIFIMIILSWASNLLSSLSVLTGLSPKHSRLFKGSHESWLVTSILKYSTFFCPPFLFFVFVCFLIYTLPIFLSRLPFFLDCSFYGPSSSFTTPSSPFSSCFLCWCCSHRTSVQKSGCMNQKKTETELNWTMVWFSMWGFIQPVFCNSVASPLFWKISSNW